MARLVMGKWYWLNNYNRRYMYNGFDNNDSINKFKGALFVAKVLS